MKHFVSGSLNLCERPYKMESFRLIGDNHTWLDFLSWMRCATKCYPCNFNVIVIVSHFRFFQNERKKLLSGIEKVLPHDGTYCSDIYPVVCIVAGQLIEGGVLDAYLSKLLGNTRPWHYSLSFAHYDIFVKNCKCDVNVLPPAFHKMV